jgi:hypothetical protein
LTVTNQATAIAYEEPGPGGPHFVTVAGRTGDENVIVEAAPSRPLNPGERITWAIDPPGGGTVEPGNPLRVLVSRRRATRVRVTASSGGTSRSLTVWAIYAQVRRVAGPAIGFAPPAAAAPGAPAACGAAGRFCVFARVDFDAEVFPKALFATPNRPSFAAAPIAPPGGANSCGAALAGGVAARFDMSRQISVAVVDPAGHVGGVCVFAPRPFPANNAEGNDDIHPGDEKDNPFVAGAIPLTGRAVALGFIGSTDTPSVIVPHALGAVGDTIEIQMRFREFSRLDYHRTWWLISHQAGWFVTFRVRRNAAGVWVDNGSVAG